MKVNMLVAKNRLSTLIVAVERDEEVVIITLTNVWADFSESPFT